MEKKKEEITVGDSVGFRAQIENVEQILELGAEGSGGEQRSVSSDAWRPGQSQPTADFSRRRRQRGVENIR